MLETREIFRNFPFFLQMAFYVVAFSAIAVFIYGFFRRYKKYRQGRDADRFNNLGARFMKAAKLMATNATVFKRDRYAGMAHWLIFWGFIVLLIGTAIVAIDHDSWVYICYRVSSIWAFLLYWTYSDFSSS